jgi:hypothetical protein
MELRKALLTKCQQQRFSISRRLKIGSSINWMAIIGEAANTTQGIRCL